MNNTYYPSSKREGRICIFIACSYKCSHYIVSVRKIASKKIGALICSMKILSTEVVLYKSTIKPCMEYWCHVWADAPSCYLNMLDALQKRVCRTAGPTLAASLELLDNHRNVPNLSLF